ncbi:MAG: polysaccharide pyruvyl transferase family protein [Acidimicrobiales bacterium]|nr:polysaccharide pyruvyl transferase family protein [Acidimicrobiales bacterium]
MSGANPWRRVRDSVLRPVTEADHEIRERVLQVLHETRNIDGTVQGLDRVEDLLAKLNHEVALREGWPERIVAETQDVVAGRVRQLAGRLVDLGTTIDTPRRDAAFEATIERYPAPDERVDGCSVLIPAWNHAVHLDTVIDLACQVTTPEHVVVLDDASDDDTAAVLAARPEPIRVLTAVENLRLTRARNVLLHVCPTRHALILDADNTVDPDAIRTLYDLAVEWDAAVAYGALVEVDGSGQATGLLSARPLNGEFFTLRHNEVDTLSVVDVDRVRAAGGYTLDPVLDTAEDWDMWHRLASSGDLLLHVPIVAGRKLVVPQGYNSTEPQDGDQKFARVDRRYRYGGRLDDRSVAAAIVHPAIGPLWASAAAVDRQPALGEALPEPHHDARLPQPPVLTASRSRVLLVAPGGVRNLGDDVLTIESVRRLRSVLDPSVTIEVISDGARPLLELDGATWIGTIAEQSKRPLRDHVAVVFGGGGTLADSFRAQGRQRADIAMEAEQAGVPLILTGQGLGGIDSTADVVRQIMGRTTAVSCRDALSVERAKALGADNVTLVGDDAARIAPPSLDRLPTRLRGLDARGWLVFHARLAGYSELDRQALDAWSDLVDATALAEDLPVVAVVQNRQPGAEIEILDELSSRQRASWSIVDCTDDPAAARSIYGLARAGVVFSYHAAWFAIEGGASVLFPTHGDYYVAKSAGLRALTGLGAAFDDATPPGDALALRARWDEVAETIATDPLSGLDDVATTWLRDALATAGVPGVTS